MNNVDAVMALKGQGYTNVSIAEKLKMPESTVRRLLHIGSETKKARETV